MQDPLPSPPLPPPPGFWYLLQWPQFINTPLSIPVCLCLIKHLLLFVYRASTGHAGDLTKVELGEKLFEMVEELCPKNADKITGMLLEMSVTDIENLMKNPQELEEKILLAEKALV